MGEWGQGGGGSPGVEREKEKGRMGSDWRRTVGGGGVGGVSGGGMRAPVPTPANPEVKQ